MFNRVILIGRLTKDCELRYTNSGNAVCNFTLAVDRSMKNAQGEKETDFIPCSVPPYKSKLAELCANYLSKGKAAAVEGRIQIRTYTDQNNQKHWITEVIVEDAKFLSPKSEGQGQQTQSQQQQQGQPSTGYPQNSQGYPQQAQGQPPQGGQPPAQNFPSYPPGSMPPPPGYTAPGSVDVNQLGRQVSLDDNIPF